MRLRAPKAGPSVRQSAAPSPTNWYLSMTHRMYGALVASLGAVALMLAADPALARPGAAVRSGVALNHPVANRSFAARAFRHHRRNNEGVGGVWAADGFYGASNGEPMAGAAPPASGDIRYTSMYDIPWDWAHRYPPAVTLSDRPYVPSCGAETVRVPGRDGGERTINVVRCY